MLRINHNQNLLSVMRWRNNRVSPAGLSTPASPSIRIGSRRREDASPVRLQIGGIDPGQQGAHSYLPASTPGIHFPGTTIRGDGSVTLPLGKLSLHSIATAQHSPRIDVLRRVLGDS
jgi:hypothetical protein